MLHSFTYSLKLLNGFVIGIRLCFWVTLVIFGSFAVFHSCQCCGMSACDSALNLRVLASIPLTLASWASGKDTPYSCPPFLILFLSSQDKSQGHEFPFQICTDGASLCTFQLLWQCFPFSQLRSPLSIVPFRKDDPRWLLRFSSWWIIFKYLYSYELKQTPGHTAAITFIVHNSIFAWQLLLWMLELILTLVLLKSWYKRKCCRDDVKVQFCSVGLGPPWVISRRLCSCVNTWIFREILGDMICGQVLLWLLQAEGMELKIHVSVRGYSVV